MTHFAGYFLLLNLGSCGALHNQTTHALRFVGTSKQIVRSHQRLTPGRANSYTLAVSDAPIHLAIRISPYSPNLIPQAVFITPNGEQDGPGVALNETITRNGVYKIVVTAREQTHGLFTIEMAKYP